MKKSLNTVLVVEDDELNLKLFKTLLQNNGFKVYSTADGKKAFGMVKKYHPDVILTDMKLNGISGIDIVKKMKADKEISSIPVIAITAFCGAEYKNSIMEAGCDEYMTKPIKGDVFVKTVQNFVI